MSQEPTLAQRNFWNSLQYNEASKKGHYESYFFRANHPDRPLAFWIRYTIFVPKNRKEKKLGELWGIFFDGEKNLVSAGKREYPLEKCEFSKDKLAIKFPDASAKTGVLSGSIDEPNKLLWDLRYQSDEAPLLLLPENLYKAPLPKAKAVVGAPLARFSGSFSVNGNVYELSEWRGSENHNWGEKHTDQYAWGQVSGFDNDASVFLEAISGKVKVGPILSPLFTILVLRVNGKDFCFNKIASAFKSKGKYDFFEWTFSAKNESAEIEGKITAQKSNFVALTYYNPPGGDHTCLNSKIASCDLRFIEKGKDALVLTSKNGTAFEILTDRTDHQLSRVV